jgi:hypothetical protein
MKKITLEQRFLRGGKRNNPPNDPPPPGRWSAQPPEDPKRNHLAPPRVDDDKRQQAGAAQLRETNAVEGKKIVGWQPICHPKLMARRALLVAPTRPDPPIPPDPARCRPISNAFLGVVCALAVFWRRS